MNQKDQNAWTFKLSSMSALKLLLIDPWYKNITGELTKTGINIEKAKYLITWLRDQEHLWQDNDKPSKFDRNRGVNYSEKEKSQKIPKNAKKAQKITKKSQKLPKTP